MTDTGRQVSHILLDALAAWDQAVSESHPDDDTNASAVNLAVQKILEIGAITVDVDRSGEDTDVVNVDASDLLGGTLVLLQWMLAQLAVYAERDRLDVIVRAREVMDELAD